jgi:hypothetical protein
MIGVKEEAGKEGVAKKSIRQEADGNREVSI